MKGGLVQLVFALAALDDLGLEPVLTPVVLINSDEEIGSVDSARYIRLLARSAARAFVLEPPAGPDGQLKTGARASSALKSSSPAERRTPERIPRRA